MPSSLLAATLLYTTHHAHKQEATHKPLHYVLLLLPLKLLLSLELLLPLKVLLLEAGGLEGGGRSEDRRVNAGRGGGPWRRRYVWHDGDLLL